MLCLLFVLSSNANLIFNIVAFERIGNSCKILLTYLLDEKLQVGFKIYYIFIFLCLIRGLTKLRPNKCCQIS